MRESEKREREGEWKAGEVERSGCEVKKCGLLEGEGGGCEGAAEEWGCGTTGKNTYKETPR